MQVIYCYRLCEEQGLEFANIRDQTNLNTRRDNNLKILLQNTRIQIRETYNV